MCRGGWRQDTSPWAGLDQISIMRQSSPRFIDIIESLKYQHSLFACQKHNAKRLSFLSSPLHNTLLLFFSKILARTIFVLVSLLEAKILARVLFWEVLSLEVVI